MINIQYCSCPTSLERLLLHLRNWRRRRRHFDFKFLRPRHILFRIFFPFLRHFNSNFIQIFPLNLARHFCGFNRHLYSFLIALSGLVVCKFLSRRKHFGRSFFFEDQQQMTSDDDCSPPNTRMYNN